MNEKLRIPTNPHYVFDQPKIRGQYVNPVSLNNYLIAAANEYYDVVDTITKLNGRLAAVKAELASTEAALDELEQELLLLHPPATGDRKSNKLLESYIRRLVMEHPEPQTKKIWTKMRESVRNLQADIVALDLERDAMFHRVQHLKLQSENIKTHLAFVKAEGRING